MANEIDSRLTVFVEQITAEILAAPMPDRTVAEMPPSQYTRRIRVSRGLNGVDLRVEYNYPQFSRYADGVKVVLDRAYGRGRKNFRLLKLRNNPTATDIIAIAKTMVGLALDELTALERLDEARNVTNVAQKNRAATVQSLVPDYTITKGYNTQLGVVNLSGVELNSTSDTQVSVAFRCSERTLPTDRLNEVLKRWAEFQSFVQNATKTAN